jgi:hypothetical protein
MTMQSALIRLKQSQENLYESACHEGNHHIVGGILARARAEERAWGNAAVPAFNGLRR